MGPALPPSGVGGEDQIEMEQNEVYGVSATDQVNTGKESLNHNFNCPLQLVDQDTEQIQMSQ